MQSERYTGFIRLLPAFLSGIFFSMCFVADNLVLLIVLLSIFLSLLSLKIFIKPNKQFSLRWMYGLLIHFAIFLCACLISSLKSEITFSNHFSKTDSVDGFICVLNESPANKANNWRFEVEISHILQGKKQKTVKGKCLIYLRKDSTLSLPEYGDELLFFKKPLDVKAPLNPGAFDFQGWLRNREIYHQVFLKSDEFCILRKEQGPTIMSTAISWRNYLLSAIKNSGISGQEYAVLSALILGQDDEIDAELRQSYSTAGVMHILAVSGMHVGLIYAALCMLIQFPGKKKKLKWLKTIFLILCLWFYAMLTGLSPSVLRAAMMLSFLVIGISLGRSSNPLNILAASAICLFVIFSPRLILSAGFQLSYMAVAGILFLFKPLHALYISKSWLFSQVWSILAVSIVAQLATFPLSIYYFHRFPNYFLLSNLLVIPLGTIVIFGGIIVLLFSWCLPVNLFLGKMLSFIIQLLNNCVAFLGELPGSSTDSIYISLIEMSLLYLAIIFLVNYLLKIRPVYFLYFFSTMLVFYAYFLFEKKRSTHQQFIVIYHVPRQTYIQFFNGREVISICDSLLAANVFLRKRISENYMLERGVTTEKIISLKDLSADILIDQDIAVKIPFIQSGSEKMYLLTKSNEKLKPDSALLDYVIINSNPGIAPDKWLEGVSCKTIIADASNSPWKIKAWKAVCEEREIRFVNIAECGAFITLF